MKETLLAVRNTAGITQTIKVTMTSISNSDFNVNASVDSLITLSSQSLGRANDDLIVRAAIGDAESRENLIELDEEWRADEVSTWEAVQVYCDGCGWSVVPQKPGDKKTYVAWKPYQEERPRVELLQQWFTTDFQDAGPAVILGPVSGLCVIDVDGQAAHDALMERLQDIPYTPMAISGSGDPFRYHLFFQHPDFETKARVTPWHDKLEFRGHKGILVLPPAVHKSGNRYAWVKGRAPWDVDIAPLPNAVRDAWEAAMVRRQPVPVLSGSYGAVSTRGLKLAGLSAATEDFLAGLYADESGWNNRLFDAACDLAGNGFSQERATDLLRRGARPWDGEQEEAMRDTIASAYREPRSPARQFAAVAEVSMNLSLDGPAEMETIEVAAQTTGQSALIDLGDFAASEDAAVAVGTDEESVVPVASNDGIGLRITGKPASRGQMQVTVFLNEEPVHTDVLQLENGKKRAPFIAEVIRRLHEKEIEVSPEQLETMLLRLLNQPLVSSRANSVTARYAIRQDSDAPDTWGMYMVMPELSRQITNFIVRIERDVSVEDELTPTRRFEGHVDLPSGSHSFSISAEEYSKDNELQAVLYKAAGTGIQIQGSLKDLRNAVSSVSEPVTRQVTPNFGWNAAETEFLFPGGRITEAGFQVATPEDQLSVDLSGEERARQLDLAPPEANLMMLKKHIAEDLLQIHPRPVMHCLLGAVGLAVLQRFVEGQNKPAIWLNGTTGSGKSFAAKLTQNFFGSFPLSSGSFVNWNSTANYIERQGYYFRDAIFVVDDFKPGVARQTDVLRVMQAYADGTSRGRLNSESTTRPSREIRGLLVSTGEDVPEHNSSTLARMIVMHVPQHEKDLVRGMRCVREAHNYSQFTAAFIEHLLVEGRIQAFRDRVSELTTFYYQGIAGQQNDIRIAGNFAQLAAAFEEVMRFMEDVLPDAGEEIRRFQEQDLIAIRNQMLVSVLAEQPSNILRETLGELITYGHVLIEGLKIPGLNQRSELSGTLIGKLARKEPPVGTVTLTDEVVCISMKMALEAVNSFLTRSSKPALSVTEQGILGQLRQDGLLLGSDNRPLPAAGGEATWQVRFNKEKLRAFRIRLGDLIGQERIRETPGLTITTDRSTITPSETAA